MPNKMRDLLVVIPGITGSVLKKDGRDLWAPSVQALWQYISQLGGSIEAMLLPEHDPRDPNPPTGGVSASRLIAGFHGVFGLGKIDGYKALLHEIESNFQFHQGNLLPFPYDWRLSNRVNAARLKSKIDITLQRLRNIDREAKVILVAHSMGGLISQYYLEVLQGWRDCKALITFGTPFRGSVNALDYLANGYKNLFLDLTSVMRTFPSVYELMPRYEMLKVGSTWHRVAECGSLPMEINPRMARDALAFHREIDEAIEKNKSDFLYSQESPDVFPIVGVRQKTLQSAELANGRILARHDLPAIIDDHYDGGDGTVPRASAIPVHLSDDGAGAYFAEQHASLQNNGNVLIDLIERLQGTQGGGLFDVQGFDELSGTQAPRELVFADGRGASSDTRQWIGLDVQDLYVMNQEPVRILATIDSGFASKGLEAVLSRVDTGVADQPTTHPFTSTSSTNWALELHGIAPGRYRADVRPVNDDAFAQNAVTAVFETIDIG